MHQHSYWQIPLTLLEHRLWKRPHSELKLLENTKYGHKFFVSLLLDIYKRADWNQLLVRLSSTDLCTAYPTPGFTLGTGNKKMTEWKFPCKGWVEDFWCTRLSCWPQSQFSKWGISGSLSVMSELVLGCPDGDKWGSNRYDLLNTRKYSLEKPNQKG